MAYADWVRSHLARTIRALRYEDADLGSEFIVDAYISGHGVGARIRIDTIDEILSTGSFGKIKDQELRQEIMRFNRVAQEAQFILDRESDYQSRYRQAMPIETIMLLRQNCAGAPVLDDRGIATFQIPPSCPPDLTPEQVTETIVSLKGADLLPILREALSDIETKRNRFQQVYEVAGEIAITLEPMN